MAIAVTTRNIRCGPNLTDIFDVSLHPVRDPGGNPLLIYRHGGGGTGGWAASLWDTTYPESDNLAAYLLSSQRAVHFDIVSVESDQAAFAFFAAPTEMARSRRVFFPEIVSSLQRNIRNVKMIMHQRYGSRHEQCFLWGSSHGAWLNMMTMLMQPDFGGTGQFPEQRRRFDTRAYTSKCKGMLNWSLAYPDWRRRDMVNGEPFTSVTVSGTAVSGGSFGHYRFVAGDHFVIVSGTGTVVPGTYTILSKNANNLALTLSTSAGAGTATGYLTSDYIWPSAGEFLFGTRSAAGVGADGLQEFSEWDGVPAALKEAASPLYWVEQNALAFAVPQIFFSSYLGSPGATRTHPWAAPWGIPTQADSIHDEGGVNDMVAALQAKGVMASSLLYDVYTNWTNGTYPKHVYDWMVARMTT